VVAPGSSSNILMECPMTVVEGHGVTLEKEQAVIAWIWMGMHIPEAEEGVLLVSVERVSTRTEWKSEMKRKAACYCDDDT